MRAAKAIQRPAARRTARSRVASRPPKRVAALSAGAARCRRKFLRLFPAGFRDETYVEWERGYKWTAHQRWSVLLPPEIHRRLLRSGDHLEIARRAIAIESRTNLLFSFEKMALRDALRSPSGARTFAEALFDFLHGGASGELRFERWCEAVASLPRRQTRVLTWPIVTVFGFLAQPDRHHFFKPKATRTAVQTYGLELVYRSHPNWDTYTSLLRVAERVRRDQRDLGPRDQIDLQSFLWVVGSDEYAEF